EEARGGGDGDGGGQDRDRLGPSDPLLRAAAVPAREGSSHRQGEHVAWQRFGRRPRSVHGGVAGAAGYGRHGVGGRGGGGELNLSSGRAAPFRRRGRGLG